MSSQPDRGSVTIRKATLRRIAMAAAILVVGGTAFGIGRATANKSSTSSPNETPTTGRAIPTTTAQATTTTTGTSALSLNDVVISYLAGQRTSPLSTYAVQKVQLSGNEGSAAIAINAQLAAVPITFINSFYAEISQFGPSPTPTPPPSTLTCTVETKRVDTRIASWIYSCSTFPSGAAHSTEYSATLNFDTRTGTQLTLADLFTPGSNYLAVLSKEAIQQLSYQQGYQPDEAAQGAGPADKNFAHFDISNNGLEVTFDSYQVGPYSMGTPTIYYSWSDLATILNPNGPVPPQQATAA